MTSKVEIVNELGEYTSTTIRARNMPELYRKIAEFCVTFDAMTNSQIVKIVVGEITIDDSEFY